MFSILWNLPIFVRVYKPILEIQDSIGGTNDEYEY